MKEDVSGRMNRAHLLQRLLQGLVDVVVVVFDEAVFEVGFCVVGVHVGAKRAAHNLALVARVHDFFTLMNLAI